MKIVYTPHPSFFNQHLSLIGDLNATDQKQIYINRKDNLSDIRRFLLHSLPKGFVRIRHYGFLANRNRNEYLKAIRNLMGLSAPPEKEVTPLEEMMLQLTGIDITVCPCCTKGKMAFFAEIPKGRARPPNHMARSMG